MRHKSTKLPLYRPKLPLSGGRQKCEPYFKNAIKLRINLGPKEKSFHEMKGDRDGKSATAYSAVVVNVSPSLPI